MSTRVILRCYHTLLMLLFTGLVAACSGADQPETAAPAPERLDATLAATLASHQFTGAVEEQLETCWECA